MFVFLNQWAHHIKCKYCFAVYLLTILNAIRSFKHDKMDPDRSQSQSSYYWVLPKPCGKLHHLYALFELCRNTTCNINMYIQCVVYASKNTVLLTEVIKQAQFAKIHYAKIYSGDWIFRYDAFGCWERSIDIDHSSTNVKPHLTTGFSAPVLK